MEFKTKWQLGLDIIDQVRGWGLADRIVVSDAAYGDATEFRDGLEARRLPYIVGISSALGVWTRPPNATVPPRHSGRGAPATRYDYGKQRPISVKEAAEKAKGLRRLVRLAKCRWKIEQDYQQLKEELGLDHYEGRSWIGWHHHTTLVMMAQAFLTLETLRRKKNFWVDLPQTRREIQYLLITWTGVCAYCKAKIKRARGS